jgi:hypothetical protein
VGRAESHALLRLHAKNLGIGYVALGSEDAREIINGRNSLQQIIKGALHDYDLRRPPILTSIDSSIRSETMRSLVAVSQETIQLPLSLKGNFNLLENYQSPLDRADNPSELDLRVAVTIVRSPHGQVAIWPVLEISRGGALTTISAMKTSPAVDLFLERVHLFAGEKNLVGALTFIATTQGEILHREWGLTSISSWSEEICHTSVAEQMVRALVDLPLGQTEIISDEEFYLQEIIDLKDHAKKIYERFGKKSGDLTQLLIDPTRPFLHLFARNPKLKVTYLDQAGEKVMIALYAPSEAKARAELEHAKDFMAGFDS